MIETPRCEPALSEVLRRTAEISAGWAWLAMVALLGAGSHLCAAPLLASPLAPPGTKMRHRPAANQPAASQPATGNPPAGSVGRPLTVVPGQPLKLKWTKVTRGAAPTRPSLILLAGRVVAGANERLLRISPEGDTAAIGDAAGHVRVVQLLSGRVSPYLKLPKGAAISLAVSGFATVGWEAETRTFHRVQSWTGRDQGHYPLPGRDPGGFAVVAPDARHGAVVSAIKLPPPRVDGPPLDEKRLDGPRWKLCVQLVALGVEGSDPRTCWSGQTKGERVTLSGVRAAFTDDGEHLWVVMTSSWWLSCGGGQEEVHAARFDVATGALTGRFDGATDTPGGAGTIGSGQVTAIVAVPGRDAVTAWDTEAPRRSDRVFWRFAWQDGRVVTTTTARAGPARPLRGGRSWVAVERGLVVVRAPGGGFVEDVAALPGASWDVGAGREGAVRVADDGRHVAVIEAAGVRLWDVQRARPVAWLPGAREVVLARSRAMWRAAGGELRTATWVQLAELLPGASGGFLARVWAVVRMLG